MSFRRLTAVGPCLRAIGGEGAFFCLPAVWTPGLLCVAPADGRIGGGLLNPLPMFILQKALHTISGASPPPPLPTDHILNVINGHGMCYWYFSISPFLRTMHED